MPVGGIAGAASGAGLGLLLAGPVGGLIGAIYGAIIGLYFGEKASDPLTEWLTCGKKFQLFCIHLNVDHKNYPAPAEVRRNYRYLMRIAHPDNNRDAPEEIRQNFIQ